MNEHRSYYNMCVRVCSGRSVQRNVFIMIVAILNPKSVNTKYVSLFMVRRLCVCVTVPLRPTIRTRRKRSHLHSTTISVETLLKMSTENKPFSANTGLCNM